MRKTLITLVLSFAVQASFSQSKVGLIAHWDMNGTVNDVSGNGHNGHANNISAATDRNGVVGKAYYFNGANSYITVPYAPSLNLSNYTICAIVKVSGFYNGICQGNVIFRRGKSTAGANGSYALSFDDNAFDNADCGAIDSTQDVFYGNAAGLGPSSPAARYYTPTIVKNTWYKVAVTFNDTVLNTYVNGTLKNTSTLTTPGVAIGSGTDSISIGYNIFEAPAYAYPFNGIIDDILLYSRVLSDTEIAHIGDTCGHITLQPVNSSIHSGGTSTYTVNSSTTGAAYQWQQDGGTGFVNLSNSGPYSGVNTKTLTITSATTSINSYHYRCLVFTSWGCSDTTVSALLSVTTDVNEALLDNLVFIYPNPTNSFVSVQLPSITNGSIQLLNEIGQLVLEKSINSKTTNLDLTGLPSGIYIAKLLVNEQVIYKKIMKH